MMQWAAFTGLTFVVLGVLLVPLLRRPEAPRARAEYDMPVYRDQLAEVARDQGSGLLTADLATAARTEIHRRMLAAADARAAVADTGRRLAADRWLRLVSAMVLIGGLPIGAFALYGWLGSPQLPDRPFSQRQDDPAVRMAQMAETLAGQSPEDQARTMQAMVERLAARLERTPNDAEGWLRLARSWRVLDDLDKAGAAVRHAIELRPKDVEARLMLADIQLAAAKDDGLPADFVATMRDVLALDADNGPALYYVGAAEAEAGHRQEARRLWSKLLASLPADGPERAGLAKQLDALGKE
jgi:cytochrome c-type biogenesis protein CcmH